MSHYVDSVEPVYAIFQLIPFLIQLIIAIVISVIAYALQPKPKVAKPEAAREGENPTAEAGRPIPVVFGTITIKSPNVLWFGNKKVTERSEAA